MMDIKCPICDGPIGGNETHVACVCGHAYYEGFSNEAILDELIAYIKPQARKWAETVLASEEGFEAPTQWMFVSHLRDKLAQAHMNRTDPTYVEMWVFLTDHETFPPARQKALMTDLFWRAARLVFVDLSVEEPADPHQVEQDWWAVYKRMKDNGID